MSAKFLGTSDDVTTCDCCGRADLKNTVALELTDGAEAVYYGFDCAARALGCSTKDVRRGTRDADRAREDEARRVRQARHDAFMARWSTFLATHAPSGHDVFTRIEALGGMPAARAAFEASDYFDPANPRGLL